MNMNEVTSELGSVVTSSLFSRYLIIPPFRNPSKALLYEKNFTFIIHYIRQPVRPRR